MKHRNTYGTTLGGDTVRLTLSKVISLCIGMLTTMLLSRFRTLQEYGTYSQILLVINLVSSLLMLGLPNSINYFLARAETQEERSKFLSLYYVLSTIISAVIGIVLVLCIPLIELYFKNNLIRSFYYFLAVYPWTTIVSSSIENVLVVFKKTRNIIIYRLSHSIAVLACILVIQWVGLGFSAYMISYVAVNCIFTLIVYYMSFHLSGGFHFTLDKELIKAIFVFSIPMGFASVVGTLNTEIDKLLIGYLMDTEQMAIYTNAAKELPLSVIATSITAVMLPQLTKMLKRGNDKEAVTLWGHATELALIVMSVIIFGVFTFAEDAMTVLYSDKYISGVSVFRVYTLNLILRITYFGIILNAAGQTKKIFWCSIYSLILNAILNPLFYWIFGMIGPALATFIAILAIQILQLKMTSRVTNVSFNHVFPWKKLAYILAVNICFAAVFYVIKQILPLETIIGSVPESLLLGVVWTVLYFIMMSKRMHITWNMLNQGETTYQ